MSSYRTTVSRSPASSSSATALAEFRTYLSRLETERIAREGSRVEPTEEQIEGAILFVDVSGFTPIAEALAKHGPHGAESLSEILNGYYGRLTNLVDAHGGDVLFFAGDAAAALFHAESAAIGDAVRAAAACGLEIRRELDGFTIGAPGAQPLSLRATVGAGVLRVLRVGVEPRLTLVTGAPFEQIGRIGALKAAHGIVLSTEAHGHLRDALGSRKLGAGFEVSGLGGSPAKLATNATTSMLSLEHVERVLPEVVVERTRAGHAAFLAEFRVVSVVFVALAPNGAPLLEGLHRAIRALTALVKRFDGAVYQFLEDDKGTTLVVSFGIFPRAHEDDAARAALFALSASSALADLGREATIGVATGRVFCGAKGGPRRRQYSLVGPTINRAARLMQAARGYGVLCDEATSRAAERHVAFEPAGMLSLKGIEEPVAVSRPVADVPVSAHRPRASMLPASVGRDAELEVLARAVDALAGGLAGGPVLLVADAGMGKSHMVAELALLAAERGVRVVQGDADSMETGTPYFAFRSVFAELAGTKGLDPPRARARVLEALSPARELAALAPLLSVVLPLDWVETPLTQQMSPQIRAENLNRLMVHLFQQTAEREAFLLVVEDGHWLDSASWAFLAQVRQLFSRVTVVLTTRPMDDEPAEYGKLRAGATLLGLPPMDRSQTIRILVHRLGVTAIPPEFVDFVVARAEGNPFYVEEVAFSLRDSGRVRVAGARLEAVDGWESLSGSSFPESLEAVITSRIDRLEAAEQLALKVASVVGRHFEEAAVLDVLPMDEDRARLPRVLARLHQLDLLAPASDSSWIFRHALTRETTYGLLSYSQRRTLHRSVAEHLERRHASDPSPVYARLAHHWRLAEDVPKAAAAYGKAGEQSLGAYANEDAVAFLSHAIELDTIRDPSPASLRRGRWLKLIGDAHYSLAEHEDARKAYEAALHSAGFHAPSGAIGGAKELGRHLLRRARSKLKLQPAEPAMGEARELIQHAMQTIFELGAVLLWQGDQTKFLESAFMHRNLADVLGPCGESAAAVCGAGFVLGMMGLHRLAERDLSRAIALAETDDALVPKIQAHVMLGMFQSLMGRFESALPPLRRAGVLSDELGGGLWKHRAKFMLGEPLLLLGAYEEASRVFGEAAVRSIGAEPSVVGFSYAMQALARLRLGEAEAALALLEGPQGVRMIRSTTVPLQLFASLGPLAESRLALGDAQGALGAILEAEAAAPGQEANGYFSGIHGHAACCTVYLSLAERAALGLPSPLTEKEALARARGAVERFARFSRRFPGALPSLSLLSGRLAVLSGRVRRGLGALDRATKTARATKMPYEEASAHFCAARFRTGEARQRHLCRLDELCARFGMKLSSLPGRRAAG